jgi:hypothetical protein
MGDNGQRPDIVLSLSQPSVRLVIDGLLNGKSLNKLAFHEAFTVALDTLPNPMTQPLLSVWDEEGNELAISLLITLTPLEDRKGMVGGTELLKDFIVK